MASIVLAFATPDLRDAAMRRLGAMGLSTLTSSVSLPTLQVDDRDRQALLTILDLVRPLAGFVVG